MAKLYLGPAPKEFKKKRPRYPNYPKRTFWILFIIMLEIGYFIAKDFDFINYIIQLGLF
jgi:hypothetical protein